MITTFTYYGREYELGFSEKTGEGYIEWLDGMYHESRSFSVVSNTIHFHPQGKMAREASKTWSMRKTGAIKALILEHISSEDGE